MRIPVRFFALMAASPAALMLWSPLAIASTTMSPLCAADTNQLLSSAEPLVSRLDVIRMQQNGAFMASSSAAELPQAAMPQPCAGALPIAALPVTSPEFDIPKMPSALLSESPDIFGSVAVAISRTPLDLKWRSASQSPLAKRAGPWAPIIRSINGQGRADQLQAINNWVNGRVRFVNDRRDKQGADQWAGATQTLRSRRGDCEDYAIAKMKLLEAIGVARTDMFLVVVDDLVRRADHALLVVRHDSKMLVLDNSTDEILDAENVADYRPIFSYGYNGTWIHGYSEKPVQLATPTHKSEDIAQVQETKLRT